MLPDKFSNEPRNYRVIKPATVLATVFCLGLSACRVGPKYHVPPATAQAPPATYKESPQNYPDSDWKIAQPGDAMLRGKWWEIFNDPELNELEDQLNIN